MRSAFNLKADYVLLTLVQPKAFPMFELKLHLPYFKLITGYPPKKAHHRMKSRLRDVSFLRAGTSNFVGRDVILQGHYSIVIHGYSDQIWDAHSFENNDFDGDDWDDEDREDENSEDEDLEDEEFQEDPNAGVEANMPIWDAREYFLRIFNVRSTQILQPAKYLVRWLERSIDNYVG